MNKVRSGDPLVIPSGTYNTFVDAAQDSLRRQRSIGRTPAADPPPFETVLLKNASGAERNRVRGGLLSRSLCFGRRP